MELLGKSKQELRALLAGWGEPAYRGDQVYRALYAEKNLFPERMTNLPAALRERLSREAAIARPAVAQRYPSRDGSVRYLLRFTAQEEAGQAAKPASVEAVYMPSEGRRTICISTQAGCAVDCRFCLTAQLGLVRNLTPGEILAQVLLPLAEHPDAEAVQTNVVLMGQGEPLLNFAHVMAALRILLDPEGVGLSPKHVTVSTSGIVPGIAKLAREPVRPKLAISLNASNDRQRSLVMPVNRKYPLAALLAACRDYPLRNWEHLTFEYVLLGGVNDSEEDARRTAKLLAPLAKTKVNLIPWNPGELPFLESSAASVERFRKTLVDRGIPAFVRYSRGRDVMAACGQLALQEVQGEPLTVIEPARPER